MLPFDWLKSFRTRLRPAPVNRRTRRAARLAVESLEAREVPAATLTIAPQSVSEAAGANAATGTITRDDDLSLSLTVNLTSSDTTEATVPATLTIPAGQAQATFPIAAVDDALVDGTQTVTISATGQTRQGAPFGLDATFGSGGLTTTSLRTNVQPSFAAIARQADGKILAASESGGDSWQLIRRNADGTVDTNFGNNGVVVTSLAAANRSYPVPHKIVVQSDGKILVGGMYGGWSQTGLTLGILARYNADGSPDATFGGGGVADLSLLANDWVEDLAVRPDGRILLGLGENGSVFSRAAQLNANGTFDATFGSSGVASLNLGYSVDRIALLPSGQFLAAGTVQQVQGGVRSSAVAVARMQANGRAVDATFGTNGVGQLNFGTDGVSLAGLALDSQGRIVCGGSTQTLSGSSLLATDFAAGRLNPDGTPDATFAGDGTGTIDVSGQGDVATSMVIQPDDWVVLGGYSELPTGRDSALARFTAFGNPDTTFDGDGGYHQSLVNAYATDMIFGVALQPDGRLLALTGWATDVRIARFNMGYQTVNVAASNTLNVLDDDTANRAPAANNQSVSTSEDTPLSGTLTASDPDGNALTYAKVSGPAHGTVTVNANGSFTYTPAANYNGPDSFTFQATDGLLNSNVATVTITVSAVNDAPVANPDAYTINEDTILSAAKPGLLGNDTDVEGDALKAVLVAGPANGSLALNSDGSFSYRPRLNYNGTDSFTYKANDGRADSAPTTVTITVNAVNDAPVPTPIVTNVTTPEDTPVSGKVSAVDPEGDSFTFALDIAPQHGSVNFGADGSYTYTPAADYNGTDSFVFRVTDSLGASRQGGVSVTVTPVNDAPTAVSDSYSVDEDNTLTIAATPVTRLRMVSDAGDFVGNGQTYDLTSAVAAFSATSNYDNGVSLVVQQPVPGEFWTLDFAAANNAALTPGVYLDAMRFPFQDPGHPGLDVSGDGRGSNTLTGRFTVFDLGKDAGGNVTRFAAAFEEHNDGDPPAFVGWVMFNSTFGAGGGVLANDTDVEGDLLLGATLVSGPQHGTLAFNGDGTFSYTPDANFNGTDTFTYRTNDGRLDSNVATVTINVRPVNDAPVASDQSVATSEDTPLSGSLSATDVDGDALTYAKVSGAQHGQVQLNADGSFTYTPAANYNGPDSFTYKANDGTADSNVATVNITVKAVNDAPVANPDAFTVDEDSYLTILPSQLLANDTDADGDALRVVVVTLPPNGFLGVAADGSFRYRANPNYNGTDSFTYKVNDGTADSAVTTVTITVNAVNDAPAAADQSVTTDEDAAASGSVAATDVDGDTLTFSLVSGPRHGAVTLKADGTFTYTPAANYNGGDSFTVKANDGTVDSNVATVSITIRPVNDAPTADAKTVGTDEDTAVAVTPTGSDVDGDTLTFAVVAAPAHGTVTVNTDGSFTYTPAADFNGSDSFTYKANDGAADSAVATVSITVRPVNDAPVAADQSVTTNEDTPLTGSLSASDVDGDALTYTVVAGPAHGTLSVGADGSFTYTPAANYNGSDSFTFQASDGTATSNIATVGITVNAVNDAPVADAKTVSTDEDTAVTVTPTGSDVEGSPLTFAVVAAPAHGTVTVNADGTFTYTPAANYNGSDSFTYRANDGSQNGDAATVSITVNAVNDAPVADDASLGTDEDLVLNGTLVATDADGDALTYSLASGPLHGTVKVNADGTFAYTPAANYNGSDSFSFQATDGTAASNTATVSISVKPVNDAPTLAPAAFTLPENSPNGTAVGTVAGTDVEGDALTYSIVGGNTSGAFAINPATGQITVANVAALDYERTPTFTLTVQVKDAGGLTGRAQVTVNLTDVPEETRVAIDILPGDDGNSVNVKSHGKIEVAILSTAGFDARTVDVSSLRFGRTGREDSLSRNPHGPRYRFADVNGDGRLDLVVTFETDETGFRVGDTAGILTGQTIDGTSLLAQDSVSIKSPGR